MFSERNDAILGVNRFRPCAARLLSVSNQAVLICFKHWKNAVYRRTSVRLYCGL